MDRIKKKGKKKRPSSSFINVGGQRALARLDLSALETVEKEYLNSFSSFLPTVTSPCG